VRQTPQVILKGALLC